MKPILYVEDEPDYQLLVQRILGRAGLEVRMADTGAQGLALLAEINPGLLILDINLPDTDGYTLCQDLRRDPFWMDLPIVMLTVRRRPEEWLRGFASGANDYISKPLNPPELVERVWSALDGKRPVSCEADTAESLLIQSAVSGNRLAFQVLLQKYRPRLVESLGALIRNDVIMEDVVAHAFAVAYEKLGEFRGQASFFTWLYRIASNQGTKDYRKPSVVSLDALEGAEDLQLPPERPEACLDERLAEKDAGRRARQALERVPLPYRTMLEMFFLEDLSYDHIALKLEIPRGTVMSRLHKGRKLLQEAARSVL